MLPFLMREYKAIQLIFDASPLRNVLGHESDKLIIVLFLNTTNPDIILATFDRNFLTFTIR